MFICRLQSAYHANNACVIHDVYFVMYVGITGIPMAILLLSIVSSIECHADYVTVFTMPYMLAFTTMYLHEYAVELKHAL